MLLGEERPADRPATTAARQLDAYLDHLGVERGVARNTLLSYRRDLLRYLDYLATRHVTDLADVTEQHIGEFGTDLRRGDPDSGRAALAASSTARALIAVRGLHRFAAAEGQTPVDVSRTVKPPTPGRRLPKALTVEQVSAILDAVGGDADGARGLRDRALLELLYSTGARISEAVGLDIDDIDLGSRAVLLRGKGGKQRVVPVGGPALSALDAYLVRGRPTLASGRTAGIFLNVRGGRLSRQSAWKVLQTAAGRAGIEAGVSPHTLRHSFATHLLDGGADVRVVQELLGHASVTTTQIYTLVTVGALRESWAQAHPRAR